MSWEREAGGSTEVFRFSCKCNRKPEGFKWGVMWTNCFLKGCLAAVRGGGLWSRSGDQSKNGKSHSKQASSKRKAWNTRCVRGTEGGLWGESLRRMVKDGKLEGQAKCGAPLNGIYYIQSSFLWLRGLHFSVYPSAKQLRLGIHTISAKTWLPLKVHVKQITRHLLLHSKIASP